MDTKASTDNTPKSTDSNNEKTSLVAQTQEDTELVMVECVSTFRTRYLVEVPVGKAIWSLDTVTMEEAKEFSQKYLGEQIVSHRVVTPEEAITLCDQDNEYCSEWPTDKKQEVFFTKYVK